MLLSLKKTSERFGVHYNTIYRAVQNGQIPSSRIGTLYKISSEWVDDVLAGRMQIPSVAAAKAEAA